MRYARKLFHKTISVALVGSLYSMHAFSAPDLAIAVDQGTSNDVVVVEDGGGGIESEQGAQIIANSDASDIETFSIVESGVTVFQSNQGASTQTTLVQSSDDLLLNADSDGGGAGTILLSVKGLTVAEVDATGVDVSGTLDVTGNTDIDSNLNVDGITTLDGTTVDGTLDVNGTTTLDGTTVGGTLDVTGNTDIDSNLNVDGITTLDGTTVDGTLNVTGATDIDSTLNVDGATALNSTLDVTGDTTLSGNTNNIGTNASTNTVTGATNNITGLTSTTISGGGDALISLEQDSGSLLVDGHGLQVTGGDTTTSVTTLSGGTNSSSLVLADESATLSVGTATTPEIQVLQATNVAGVTAVTIGSNSANTSSINSYAGDGYSTVNTSNTTIGTTDGGMVQTSATSATIRASSSGSLATNGTTGIMSVNNGGGYAAYKTSQTVASSVGGVLDGVEYTNQINGNTLVDGNLYINGTLSFVSSDAANTSVVGGASVLPNATQLTNGGSAIVLKDTEASHTVIDGNGRLTNINGVAAESTASVTLTNGYGEVHGLAVTESQATLSGGTRSTSMTLNDNGATFSNAATGAPVQIHGVADGTADYDAVNVRQLRSLKRGLAATTAMINIPALESGKNLNLGLGIGGYDGESALAFGGSARLRDNIVAKASVGHAFSGDSGSKETTWGVGVGMSW